MMPGSFSILRIGKRCVDVVLIEESCSASRRIILVESVEP
jgi:hypothetical protein